MNNSYINEAAIDRCFHQLALFSKQAKLLGTKHIIIYGTSALRGPQTKTIC